MEVLSTPSPRVTVTIETTGVAVVSTDVLETTAVWTLVAPGMKKEAEPLTARALVRGRAIDSDWGILLPVVVTTAELMLAPTSDDTAEASETGHTVVVSPTMLVTMTGWTAELPWEETASAISLVLVAAGQFVTVGAQEITV